MGVEKYQHRKSRAKIRVNAEGGKPVAGLPVTVKQTNHEFLFGVGGFDAVELAGGNPDGTPLAAEQKAVLSDRLDKVFSVMNYTTLPFYWGRYEAEEGKPDEKRLMAAADYYRGKNIKVKGHPLCWHTVAAPWLMKYSNREILSKIISRIERDAGNFAGRINMWDVINEVVIMPIFDKYDNAVTRVCKEIGRVSMIREVFNAARRANPQAVLLLNDFDMSTKYEILIDGCLQAGIPIDVIGLQSHQHQGYWGAEKTMEVLDRYSHFGIPLHFTENTIISGDIMPAHIEDLNDWQVDAWPSTPEGEERQARELVELYTNLFSHPSVEAITTWDAVDGKWLKAPSGILREDNGVKPVFTELKKKIRGEWWTETTVTTDANGYLEFEGFRGEYTAEHGGNKIPFVLDKNGGPVAITLA
ncbi:beta-xylanase [Spirochaetia bacterium]|nr:beta-xylanase [Spirochaetia bacterium]